MITAHSESEVRIDWRLPNYTRSILAENHKALFRRWKIARSTELFDPRVLSRWFPGQRGLLDLLAVLSEEEVLRVADTKAPLFTMTLHDGLRPAASAARVQPGEFEAANRQEAFMALSVRLDAIRTSTEQACVQFDMSASDANFLGRMGPHDQWDVAANPTAVLIPAASDQFFSVAAAREMTVAQRTLYMGVSKRSKDSVH